MSGSISFSFIPQNNPDAVLNTILCSSIQMTVPTFYFYGLRGPLLRCHLYHHRHIIIVQRAHAAPRRMIEFRESFAKPVYAQNNVVLYYVRFVCVVVCLRACPLECMHVTTFSYLLHCLFASPSLPSKRCALSTVGHLDVSDPLRTSLFPTSLLHPSLSLSPCRRATSRQPHQPNRRVRNVHKLWCPLPMHLLCDRFVAVMLLYAQHKFAQEATAATRAYIHSAHATLCWHLDNLRKRTCIHHDPQNADPQKRAKSSRYASVHV